MLDPPLRVRVKIVVRLLRVLRARLPDFRVRIHPAQAFHDRFGVGLLQHPPVQPHPRERPFARRPSFAAFSINGGSLMFLNRSGA